jgi:phage shock protein A
MGLFRRLGDIFTSNLEDAVTKMEDPEKLLRSSIRDMESAVREAEQAAAKSMASEKLLLKEIERNRQSAADSARQAEAAVDRGDDEVARKALERQDEYAKLTPVLERQRETLAEGVADVVAQLGVMRERLAEAKRNLASLSARKKAADFRKKMAGGETEIELDQDAFAKFDRLRERVEQAEAEAEALTEIRGKKVRPLEPSHTTDLEERLAELKRERARN